MNDLQEELEKISDSLQYIFITIDQQRHTKTNVTQADIDIYNSAIDILLVLNNKIL